MAHTSATKPLLVHFTPAENKIIEDMQSQFAQRGQFVSKTKIARALVNMGNTLPALVADAVETLIKSETDLQKIQ